MPFFRLNPEFPSPFHQTPSPTAFAHSTGFSQIAEVLLHHQAPTEDVVVGQALPPPPPLSSNRLYSLFSELHDCFLAVFFSGFWVTCLFGRDSLSFDRHFVLASRNWVLPIPDAGNYDLREFMSSLADTVDQTRISLRDTMAESWQNLEEHLSEVSEARLAHLLSLIRVEQALHFLAQRGVRTFVHSGFRTTMTDLVSAHLPSADSLTRHQFLHEMLDHPSATIINPVLQPDSFWHQIAVLPSDWQDPQIPADHRARIISFEDMAEAWDSEHGFTVGTFHDPLIDGDDSACVLSGVELRDFTSSVGTPLSHFYNPDVEERYTPPPPHPLLRPSRAPGAQHPPPLHIATPADLEWFVAYVASLETSDPTFPPPSAPSARGRPPGPKRSRSPSLSSPHKKCVFRRATPPASSSSSHPGILKTEPRPRESRSNRAGVLPIREPPQVPCADRIPPHPMDTHPIIWANSQVQGAPRFPAPRELARTGGPEHVFSGESHRPVRDIVRGLVPGCKPCQQRNRICATGAGSSDRNENLPTKGCSACDICLANHRSCDPWREFTTAFNRQDDLSCYQFEFWEHLGSGHFAPLEQDPRLWDLTAIARERLSRRREASKRNAASSTPNPSNRSSPPPSWARASNATPHSHHSTKTPTGPSSRRSRPTETPASGSNPSTSNIPPVEIIDISDSEEDVPLAPPFQHEQEEDVVPLPTPLYTPVIGPDDYEMDVDTPTPLDPAAQVSTSNLDDLRQPVVSRPPLPSQMAFLGIPLEDFKDQSSFNEASLKFDTEALLKYYEAHPIGDRLHAHAYLKALFMLVGNHLRGYDLDLEANSYAGQLNMDEEMIGAANAP
ncbi:hypothetical protein C8J57DRAFT_1518421 [Mycena rebaudengoi]|nr:hypothetical protein C8J57DRAFT_1518421 [Mycena rebaudengoi]